jgi:curved DNA-binding protein CbpA
MKHTYYQILGVSRNASANEVKKAYRRLAIRAHPDQDKTSGATERFQMLSEAYMNLSDPDQRAAYDRELDEEARQERSRQEARQRHESQARQSTRARQQPRERVYRSRHAREVESQTIQTLSSLFGTSYPDEVKSSLGARLVQNEDDPEVLNHIAFSPNLWKKDREETPLGETRIAAGMKFVQMIINTDFLFTIGNNDGYHPSVMLEARKKLIETATVDDWDLLDILAQFVNKLPLSWEDYPSEVTESRISAGMKMVEIAGDSIDSMVSLEAIFNTGVFHPGVRVAAAKKITEAATSKDRKLLNYLTRFQGPVPAKFRKLFQDAAVAAGERLVGMIQSKGGLMDIMKSDDYPMPVRTAAGLRLMEREDTEPGLIALMAAAEKLSPVRDRVMAKLVKLGALDQKGADFISKGRPQQSAKTGQRNRR